MSACASKTSNGMPWRLNAAATPRPQKPAPMIACLRSVSSMAPSSRVASLRQVVLRQREIVRLRRVEIAPHVLANALQEDARADGVGREMGAEVGAGLREADPLLAEEHRRRRRPRRGEP